MLQSMGALIIIETYSSADSYGLLTGNTAVGEDGSVRAWPPRMWTIYGSWPHVLLMAKSFLRPPVC
jgi:hypothetical protein